MDDKDTIRGRGTERGPGRQEWRDEGRPGGRERGPIHLLLPTFLDKLFDCNDFVLNCVKAT